MGEPTERKHRLAISLPHEAEARGREKAWTKRIPQSYYEAAAVLEELLSPAPPKAIRRGKRRVVVVKARNGEITVDLLALPWKMVPAIEAWLKAQAEDAE
jgi:hypothetical protein